MKNENTSLRLQKIMSDRDLRQVDILNLTIPYCHKYNVKMNKSDISQYVSGKVEPNQDKLAILGMALGVSETWLMGYDVPMERNNPEKSLSNILNERLRELGMTLEEVAQKSDVSLYWLQHLDNFIPGEMGPDEIGYTWVTKVAEAVGLSGATLRAALARQEIPTYKNSATTAEEAYKNAMEDFREPINELHTDSTSIETFSPEVRAAARGMMDLSPEDQNTAMEMIKFLSKKGKEALED